MAGPSLGQECSAEKMEDTIIDIDLSLARGIRGAEPAYAPTAAACVRACCSGEKLSGNRLLLGPSRQSDVRPLGELILKFGLAGFSGRRDEAALSSQHRSLNLGFRARCD